MDNTLDFSQQIMLKYSLLFYYNTNQSTTDLSDISKLDRLL